MKLLSILLRVLAVAGAGFCAFVWFDTKGKTSTSMEHMKDVQGETLQDKTAKVPTILKNKAATEKNLKATTEKLKDTQSKLADTDSDLQNERARMVQANSDLVKKNSELRQVKSNLASVKGQISEKDDRISVLESELLKIKNDYEPIIASLKKQIAEKEAALAAKDSEMAEAIKKAEEAAVEKMQQVVEIDEKTGKKVVKMVKKTEPYKATGEMAAVLKTDISRKLFVINKGKADKLSDNLALQIKNEGKFIADIVVVSADEKIAVCAVLNDENGLSERIEEGDVYELCPAPVVEDKKAEKKAE